MATEEVYDRWHKARPKPGEKECPEHPGLIPTAIHGCEMRWQARWRDQNGRQESKVFPKNRKTAAQKYQRSQRAAVEEGRDPLPHRGRKNRLRVPTIAEYVETFLSEHEARNSTLEGYGYRLRGYVVPRIGSRRITEVRRPEYRQLFSELRVDGTGDAYRQQVKKALSSMLSAAVDDPRFGYLIPGNQVIGIKLPSGRRQKARLTWEHVVALADEISPGFEMLIWYGALEGLRSMEAAAVRITDMMRTLKKMEVSEQRQRGESAPLKTEHSYAVVPVGEFLWERYALHLVRRTAPPSDSAMRHRRVNGWTPRPEEYDELVTVTRRGTPLRRNTLSEAFNRAKERARGRGVMVPATATFRDLRDFMDAVLIAAGVPLRDVQQRMRHGTLGETLDTYGFATEVDWQNAPASFEELFGIPAPPGLPETALLPRARRMVARREGTRPRQPGVRPTRASRSSGQTRRGRAKP